MERLRLTTLVFVAIMACSAGPTRAKGRLKVFILSGQSNMEGKAAVTQRCQRAGEGFGAAATNTAPPGLFSVPGLAHFLKPGSPSTDSVSNPWRAKLC